MSCDSPIRVGVLSHEMNALKKWIDKALHPTVEFTGDLESMRKAAEEERVKCLGIVKVILDKYNYNDDEGCTCGFCPAPVEPKEGIS